MNLTWKVYGPDINGTFGGLQGTGGLEATIMNGTGTATGVINDYFGNGVATISGGSVTWNTTKVGGYGPLPDSTATPLTDATQLAQATVWRGHRIDPTGFYYLGARYYEPTSGRFLSPDPKGQAASMSLYDFCNGDPVNGFDPDGRCNDFYNGLPNYRDFIGPGDGVNISNTDPNWQGVPYANTNNTPAQNDTTAFSVNSGESSVWDTWTADSKIKNLGATSDPNLKSLMTYFTNNADANAKLNAAIADTQNGHNETTYFLSIIPVTNEVRRENAIYGYVAPDGSVTISGTAQSTYESHGADENTTIPAFSYPENSQPWELHTHPWDQDTSDNDIRMTGHGPTGLYNIVFPVDTGKAQVVSPNEGQAYEGPAALFGVKSNKAP